MFPRTMVQAIPDAGHEEIRDLTILPLEPDHRRTAGPPGAGCLAVFAAQLERAAE